MKHLAEALTSGCGKLPSLILISVILWGCQSLTVDPKGHTVPEADWILLSQSGNQSGRWQSEDLVLDYKYDRDHSQLSIYGIVHFTERITGNFPAVQYFHLDAIPVDAGGRVLDMIGLTSAGDVNMLYDGPIDFNRILTLPPNTAAIAFSYRGRAYGGDLGFGGGYMDFWIYPVY